MKKVFIHCLLRNAATWCMLRTTLEETCFISIFHPFNSVLIVGDLVYIGMDKRQVTQELVLYYVFCVNVYVVCTVFLS